MSTPEGGGEASTITMSHSIFFGRDSKNSVPIEAPRGANLYDFIEDAARHLRRQIKANLNIREEDFERLMGKPDYFILRVDDMMVTPELWAKVFGQGFYAAGGLELALGGRAQYEFAAPQPRPLPTQDTHVDVTAAPIQTKKSHHFDGSLESMLMEILDNAIDATKTNAQRRLIAVRLHQAVDRNSEKVDGKFALTISDNGIAMDQTKLATCCTYGYDQKSRGHDHQQRLQQLGDNIPFIDSEFSRFGAGLLEAAFAIGDDLYIMSKRHDEEKVVQGWRSKTDFDTWLQDKKENNGRNTANKMPIKTRKPGAINEDHRTVVQFDQQEWPTIVDIVLGEEQKRVEAKEGFTTVVITGVDNDLVQQFQEEDENGELVMAKGLANAYFYFLEREDTSAAEVGSQNTRAQQHDKSDNMLPNWLKVTHNKLPRSTPGHDVFEKPLSMTLQQLGSEPVDLSTVRCFQHDLIEKCADTKWFFYRFDDCGNSLVGLGVMRYFPTRDCAETAPFALAEKQVVFRWQGRTMAKQTLDQLSFTSLIDDVHDGTGIFTKRPKSGTYGTNNLPGSVGKRWHCEMLLPGSFKPSTNKLTLDLSGGQTKGVQSLLDEAEFSNLMTGADIANGYAARKKLIWEDSRGKGKRSQIQDRFRKWLKTSHKNFDQDVKFADLLTDKDLIDRLHDSNKSDLLPTRFQKAKRYCSQVELSSKGHGPRKVRHGDIVKIKGTTFATTVYGKVIGFRSDQDVRPEQESEGSATGLLFYTEAPDARDTDPLKKMTKIKSQKIDKLLNSKEFVVRDVNDKDQSLRFDADFDKYARGKLNNEAPHALEIRIQVPSRSRKTFDVVTRQKTVLLKAAAPRELRIRMKNALDQLIPEFASAYSMNMLSHGPYSNIKEAEEAEETNVAIKAHEQFDFEDKDGSGTVRAFARTLQFEQKGIYMLEFRHSHKAVCLRCRKYAQSGTFLRWKNQSGNGFLCEGCAHDDTGALVTGVEKVMNADGRFKDGRHASYLSIPTDPPVIFVTVESGHPKVCSIVEDGTKPLERDDFLKDEILVGSTDTQVPVEFEVWDGPKDNANNVDVAKWHLQQQDVGRLWGMLQVTSEMVVGRSHSNSQTYMAADLQLMTAGKDTNSRIRVMLKLTPPAQLGPADQDGTHNCGLRLRLSIDSGRNHLPWMKVGLRVRQPAPGLVTVDELPDLSMVDPLPISFRIALLSRTRAAAHVKPGEWQLSIVLQLDTISCSLVKKKRFPDSDAEWNQFVEALSGIWKSIVQNEKRVLQKLKERFHSNADQTTAAVLKVTADGPRNLKLMCERPFKIKRPSWPETGAIVQISDPSDDSHLVSMVGAEISGLQLKYFDMFDHEATVNTSAINVVSYYAGKACPVAAATLPMLPPLSVGNSLGTFEWKINVSFPDLPVVSITRQCDVRHGSSEGAKKWFLGESLTDKVLTYGSSANWGLIRVFAVDGRGVQTQLPNWSDMWIEVTSSGGEKVERADLFEDGETLRIKDTFHWDHFCPDDLKVELVEAKPLFRGRLRALRVPVEPGEAESLRIVKDICLEAVANSAIGEIVVYVLDVGENLVTSAEGEMTLSLQKAGKRKRTPAYKIVGNVNQGVCKFQPEHWSVPPLKDETFSLIAEFADLEMLLEIKILPSNDAKDCLWLFEPVTLQAGGPLPVITVTLSREDKSRVTIERTSIKLTAHIDDDMAPTKAKSYKLSTRAESFSCHVAGGQCTCEPPSTYVLNKAEQVKFILEHNSSKFEKTLRVSPSTAHHLVIEHPETELSATNHGASELRQLLKPKLCLVVDEFGNPATTNGATVTVSVVDTDGAPSLEGDEIGSIDIDENGRWKCPALLLKIGSGGNEPGVYSLCFECSILSVENVHLPFDFITDVAVQNTINELEKKLMDVNGKIRTHTDLKDRLEDACSTVADKFEAVEAQVANLSEETLDAAIQTLQGQLDEIRIVRAQQVQYPSAWSSGIDKRVVMLAVIDSTPRDALLLSSYLHTKSSMHLMLPAAGRARPTDALIPKVALAGDIDELCTPGAWLDLASTESWKDRICVVYNGMHDAVHNLVALRQPSLNQRKLFSMLFGCVFVADTSTIGREFWTAVMALNKDPFDPLARRPTVLCRHGTFSIVDGSFGTVSTLPTIQPAVDGCLGIRCGSERPAYKAKHQLHKELNELQTAIQARDNLKMQVDDGDSAFHDNNREHQQITLDLTEAKEKQGAMKRRLDSADVDTANKAKKKKKKKKKRR